MSKTTDEYIDSHIFDDDGSEEAESMLHAQEPATADLDVTVTEDWSHRLESANLVWSYAGVNDLEVDIYRGAVIFTKGDKGFVIDMDIERTREIFRRILNKMEQF